MIVKISQKALTVLHTLHKPLTAAQQDLYERQVSQKGSLERGEKFWKLRKNDMSLPYSLFYYEGEIYFCVGTIGQVGVPTTRIKKLVRWSDGAVLALKRVAMPPSLAEKLKNSGRDDYTECRKESLRTEVKREKQILDEVFLQHTSGSSQMSGFFTRISSSTKDLKELSQDFPEKHYALMPYYEHCVIDVLKKVSERGVDNPLLLGEYLTEYVFLPVLLQTKALHVHNYVHRDIKPDNFMFEGDIKPQEDGKYSAEVFKTLKLHMIDYGAVAKKGEQRLPAGTTGYLPPEVKNAIALQQEVKVCQSHDIFSLARFWLLLIRCCGASYSEEFYAEASKLLTSMLNPDTAKRPDIDEVLESVNEILSKIKSNQQEVVACQRQQEQQQPPSFDSPTASQQTIGVKRKRSSSGCFSLESIELESRQKLKGVPVPKGYATPRKQRTRQRKSQLLFGTPPRDRSAGIRPALTPISPNTCQL